ncbi:hypothetical protein EDD21DRAFT_72147 [Dissophora ornata]|nr:hypothetical protein EDD21DRAFT_72147 [Dissophora ornata]
MNANCYLLQLSFARLSFNFFAVIIIAGISWLLAAGFDAGLTAKGRDNCREWRIPCLFYFLVTPVLMLMCSCPSSACHIKTLRMHAHAHTHTHTACVCSVHTHTHTRTHARRLCASPRCVVWDEWSVTRVKSRFHLMKGARCV